MNKQIFKLFHRIIVLSSLIVVTFLIFSCSITGSVVREENQKNPEIYFCPKEDCSKVLEKHVSSANSSVHCAIYDLKLRNVINALAVKSRTADVKIVTDNSNNEGQIRGEGLKEDSPNQLMHNKFCIIDRSAVITGSFNPTDNDNYRNNNNVIVIYSNTIAQNYEDEFNELWRGTFSGGKEVKHHKVIINGIEIENYFCPEDNCESHILDLIRSAKSSVYFMDFSFTSREIADAIISKKALDTRGILDSSQSSSKYSQLEYLQENNINAIKDNNKYKMHHKVFIIDNQTVATGSYNPTESGDKRNDENIIIIHDKNITSYFLKEFDSIS